MCWWRWRLVWCYHDQGMPRTVKCYQQPLETAGGKGGGLFPVLLEAVWLCQDFDSKFLTPGAVEWPTFVLSCLFWLVTDNCVYLWLLIWFHLSGYYWETQRKWINIHILSPIYQFFVVRMLRMCYLSKFEIVWGLLTVFTGQCCKSLECCPPV